MTEALKIAVEGLYHTFSKYRLPLSTTGCPCCVTKADTSKLHSKPLRILSGDDIRHYAWKAMTTWGSVDDFKYYLPRLLELASTGELELDNFIILGKLGYADWKNWDTIEQETITHFLKSWWKYEINNGQYLESKTLLELLKYIDDFQWMLNCWNLEIDTVGFRKFIDLVEYDYWSLSQENQTFKKLSKAQLSLFIEWIESKSSLLEKAFFEFEKTDVEFSTRISNSLYMIECKTE